MRQHRTAGAAALGLLLTAATLFLVGKVGLSFYQAVGLRLARLLQWRPN